MRCVSLHRNHGKSFHCNLLSFPFCNCLDVNTGIECGIFLYLHFDHTVHRRHWKHRKTLHKPNSGVSARVIVCFFFAFHWNQLICMRWFVDCHSTVDMVSALLRKRYGKVLIRFVGVTFNGRYTPFCGHAFICFGHDFLSIVFVCFRRFLRYEIQIVPNNDHTEVPI